MTQNTRRRWPLIPRNEAMTENSGVYRSNYIFTPRDTETNERYDLRINLDDRDLFNRSGEDWVRVTDQVTGVRYEARKASCGLMCQCDAIARPIGL